MNIDVSTSELRAVCATTHEIHTMIYAISDEICVRSDGVVQLDHVDYYASVDDAPAYS